MWGWFRKRQERERSFEDAYDILRSNSARRFAVFVVNNGYVVCDVGSFSNNFIVSCKTPQQIAEVIAVAAAKTRMGLSDDKEEEGDGYSS